MNLFFTLFICELLFCHSGIAGPTVARKASVNKQLENNDDYEITYKMFENRKGKDGYFAQDYMDKVEETFKKNPKTYILAAKKYFSENYECPTWLLVSEASGIPSKEVISRAEASFKNEPKNSALQAFLESVRRQTQAIEDPKYSQNYRDCK